MVKNGPLAPTILWIVSGHHLPCFTAAYIHTAPAVRRSNEPSSGFGLSGDPYAAGMAGGSSATRSGRSPHLWWGRGRSEPGGRRQRPPMGGVTAPTKESLTLRLLGRSYPLGGAYLRCRSPCSNAPGCGRSPNPPP